MVMFDRIIHSPSQGCQFWGTLSLLCLISFYSYAGELPEREELFARTPWGTHRIHATTQADVTGKGKFDLSFTKDTCLPQARFSKPEGIQSRKDDFRNKHISFC